MASQRVASALILSLVVSTSLACKCLLQPPTISFCRAKWVSHVTVASVSEPVKAELQPAGVNATNFHYKVRHNTVFKAPIPEGGSANGTTKAAPLPAIVISPADGPACGIQLAAGHDYLLAGQLSDTKGGPLMTFLCGQVLLDSKDASAKHDVLEWREVPKEMRQKLKTHAFDPLCQKLKAEEAKAP